MTDLRRARSTPGYSLLAVSGVSPASYEDSSTAKPCLMLTVLRRESATRNTTALPAAASHIVNDSPYFSANSASETRGSGPANGLSDQRNQAD